MNIEKKQCLHAWCTPYRMGYMKCIYCQAEVCWKYYGSKEHREALGI